MFLHFSLEANLLESTTYFKIIFERQ